MSVVYLAEHVRLGRKVALKLLAPELADSERFHDRFLRESKLAASIDHPNIVPIYDADEAEGVLHRDALRRGIRPQAGDPRSRSLDPGARRRDRRPGRERARCRPRARARPSRREAGNVLLTPDDHAYVSDFGLTKRPSVSGLTETGQLIGTIDYVAPEQIKGDPVDQRADVYSLGCMSSSA